MNNELTDREFEELKLLYTISASDLAFFKRQQWVVVNYALVLYTALVAIGTKLLPSPKCWEKMLLGVIAALFAIAAHVILCQLQVAMNIRRKRLADIRPKFSNKFNEAWSSEEKQSDHAYQILFAVLYLGLIAVCWILYRMIT